MNGPTFVALDPGRNIGGTTATWLYVSEHGETDGSAGGRIFRFNTSTGASTVIMAAYDATTNPNGFKSPDAIVIDPTTGDLFISDRFLNRVQRITNTGTFVMRFGSSTALAPDEMHGPLGLARDASGAIYVGEHGDTNGGGVNPNMVSKYTFPTPTTVLRSWRVGGTGSGNGQFSTPYGLLVNGSSLLVSDGFNARVQSLDTATGAYQSQFSVGSGVIPLGLSITGSTLYVGEGSLADTQQVNRRNPATGAQLAAGPWGSSGSGNGQFNLPFSAVVDATTNRAYVADYGNDRVQVFDLSATSTTPVVTSGATASAQVGTPFNYQITATNSPTSYGATGFPTNGLTFNSTTGVISGTPTAATNVSTQITATNASGTSAPVTLTITVQPASSGDTTPPSISNFAIDLGTATLTTASFVVTFNEPVTGVDATDFALNAIGGATATITGVTAVSSTEYRLNFNYSGSAGSIQGGIKTTGTGIADLAGNAFLGFGLTASAPVGVNSAPPADMTPPTVSSFTAGTPSGSTVNFSLTFSEAVTGVSAADFVIIKSSTATATGGTITGSGAGPYTIPVTFGGTGSIQLVVVGGVTADIRDSTTHWFGGGANQASATFTIGGGGSVPVVSNATVTGQVGTPITAVQVSATNSPTSFSAPGLATYGLSISASGLITGTPTTTATGATVSVTATNSAGTSAAATITLNISPASSGSVPVVSNATVTGQVGTPITAVQVSATNSPTSFSAPGLATYGLSISASGLITGTPTTAASGATATVTASNSAGTSAAATITLNISPASSGSVPVVSNATVTGQVGTPITAVQVSATNSPTSFSASGLATYGLSISASGLITGTPTTAASGATVSVTASNSAGTSAAATITLNISPASSGSVPVVSNATVSGKVGTPITAVQVAATNSPTSFSASGLATYGLSISSTGLITGTPTQTATGATVSVTAANSAGTSAAATITLNITPASTGSVPVVSNASVSGQVGTPIAAVQVSATNSPTSFSASGLAAYGLSISSTGLISGTPSATASGATVSVTASNAAGTSAAATITLNISAAPPPPPPPSGGGGGGGGTISLPTTIVFTPSGDLFMGASLTLSATSSSGAPVSFSVISGSATLNGNLLTPTGPGAIVVRASAPASGIYQATSTDATITVKSKQTISFVSPTSNIVINTPITLSAQSSAGLPITFTLVTGNATLNGNTLTPTGPGAIVVRASSAGNSTTAPESVDVNFGSPQKAAQSINLAVLSDLTTAAGPITLPAQSSAGLNVAYTVSGPARLQGNNTIVLNGAPGTVTIRATAAGNDSVNAAETSRTFNVRAIGQQVYLGNIGSDTVAVAISQDNSKGVFVTRFAATGEALVAKFKLNANGTFSTSGVSSLPASDEQTDTPPTAALVARTINGTVSNGVVTGTIPELNTNFTANVMAPTGSTSGLAGIYVASIPGSASGDTYLVVGPTGQAYAVAVTPFGVTSGSGTISSTGEFNIETSSGGTIAGTVSTADGTMRGTLTNGSITTALVGLSEGVDRSDRLVNLSSRLRTSSDATRAMIAGFVVTGTEAKQMLIRAIGPSLSAFGVQGALANPRLQVYNSAGVLIAENEDWGNNADVAAAADNVGAFKLDAASRDAAILATLEPGAYTAQVATNGGTGVALVEVYDVAGSAGNATSKQLINISTRGFVDTGDGNLIAGFVVSGNVPKRVLVRGIGPSLTQFGVQGAVANPTLKLYAAGSTAVIAQNDDWSTAQPINTSQAAATAADITAASTASGAFPLAANSRDAAIVITLMPGAYTAVVGDATNGTGAGLIEVYEISNQ